MVTVTHGLFKLFRKTRKNLMLTGVTPGLLNLETQ